MLSEWTLALPKGLNHLFTEHDSPPHTSYDNNRFSFSGFSLFFIFFPVLHAVALVGLTLNGLKWLKMTQNGPKWLKITQNDPKWRSNHRLSYSRFCNSKKLKTWPGFEHTPHFPRTSNFYHQSDRVIWTRYSAGTVADWHCGRHAAVSSRFANHENCCQTKQQRKSWIWPERSPDWIFQPWHYHQPNQRTDSWFATWRKSRHTGTIQLSMTHPITQSKFRNFDLLHSVVWIALWVILAIILLNLAHR